MYTRGQHPKSQANLLKDKKPYKRGQPKKKRDITVTEEGWQGCKEIAKSLGISLSEVLEAIGRKELLLLPNKETDAA